MLDKLLNWWYNGNAGRWVRRRHAQKKTYGIIHPTGHRANPQPKSQAHREQIHRSNRTADS